MTTSPTAKTNVGEHLPPPRRIEMQRVGLVKERAAADRFVLAVAVAEAGDDRAVLKIDFHAAGRGEVEAAQVLGLA
jgi:hypothetical protein